jgi:Ribonuclease G/E
VDATVHAACGPGEVRIAVMANGVLADYALWRPGAPDGVGDVYRGRVTAIVPAMAGAFVALSVGSAVVDGFLPNSDGANGLNEGTIITVQVTRAASGGKGPRLTAHVPDAGEGKAGLVRRGIDPLRELAARYPDATIRVDDAAMVASLRADLGGRVVLVPRAFDDAIESDVEGLGEAVLTLASGVRLSIYPTPALVAIDVDGGGALVGPEAAARRHQGLNAEVIPEIARQIRLRNLSGAILVDLAGLKAKQRAALGPGLAAALASDPSRPRFLGFTTLGLAEITRPRVRAPLHEALSGPLAAGLLALRVIARATKAVPGRRFSLRAAPAVVAVLQADPVALVDLARITGQALYPHSDPSLPDNGYLIETVYG